MHGTPQTSFPNLSTANGSLKSSDSLHAGFALANGGKSGHSCSVRIVEDIRQYAAERILTECEALEKGAEVYATA